MRSIFSVAIVAAFLLPTLPVMADPPPWAPAHGRRAKDAERDEERYRDRHEDRDDDARLYYRDDHRHHDRRLVRYDEVIYHGDDGRYYCHRSDGTTGLIVGAVAGGIVGNQLARGRSAALGTVLGVAGGALIGQAIDRDRVYCE
ncbi:MAG TPA: glycine zipper 2TM domain-containing protein [Rhizomicrobium sp.]|nr:glycine zipper 2TM domain-containing protein [Rhizomicrobium sp.]